MPPTLDFPSPKSSALWSHSLHPRVSVMVNRAWALTATTSWKVSVRGLQLGLRGPPQTLPYVGCGRQEKVFQGCSHSESPKSHQSLFPAPNGRGRSGQNALDRCHLRFSERGQSRRARRNKGDFLYCWHVLGVSGCRAGIPSPGKSHGHVKEHDDGKKSEISFLPLYNDALSLELRKLGFGEVKRADPGFELKWVWLKSPSLVFYSLFYTAFCVKWGGETLNQLKCSTVLKEVTGSHWLLNNLIFL